MQLDYRTDKDVLFREFADNLWEHFGKTDWIGRARLFYSALLWERVDSFVISCSRSSGQQQKLIVFRNGDERI